MKLSSACIAQPGGVDSTIHFQIIIHQKQKSAYSNATDTFVDPALCNDNGLQ
jgi:hypothetical protein